GANRYAHNAPTPRGWQVGEADSRETTMTYRTIGYSLQVAAVRLRPWQFDAKSERVARSAARWPRDVTSGKPSALAHARVLVAKLGPSCEIMHRVDYRRRQSVAPPAWSIPKSPTWRGLRSDPRFREARRQYA